MKATYLGEFDLDEASDNDEVIGLVCESCKDMLMFSEGEWEQQMNQWLKTHETHGDIHAIGRTDDPNIFRTVGVFRHTKSLN